MKAWQNPWVRIVLGPLACSYGAVTGLRNRLYDAHIIKSFRLNARVISVGNITVGGTGKTPVVAAIARSLQARGKRVVIQSRGYGRKSHGFLMVSDTESVLTTAACAGDEPYMLATTLPGIPVIVGADRLEACRNAIAHFGPDILILDDAFQHRCIRRDMDVVTMDTSAPWGNGALLPAGPLREAKHHLKRADIVVLTRAHEPDQKERRKQDVGRWTNAPVTFSEHKPVEWIHLKSGAPMPLTAFENEQAIALSGIANPDSFLDTLRSCAVEPLEMMRFPDHHWYTPNDLKKIARVAAKHQASLILTTEKDGVRLEGLNRFPIPVYCLRIACTLEALLLDRIMMT
ncbi:tetraacyldisaccharide 4'-kinase [bacterium]|nr:tetraacyldisaccharide 4'-kinase [bacterium]